jgi:YihY family inner membrane protein
LRQVGWAERQVRRADRFQQRHAVLAFPWAVAQKFGNDQAGGKAALMAYYGLFALFPLLLLLATVLGFALSGNPALRDQLIDSALGKIPVIGAQLSSQVHPLEGNTVALVIGIIGTLYGSLGVGFASQNAMNTVWNIPFVRWPGIGTRYARTLGIIGLLGLGSISSTVLSTFATAVAHGQTATVLAVTASFLVNLGLFLLAFMVLTAEPLRLREVAVGAVIATVFWQALQLIGTWYVTRGLRTASPTYGVFAVVITLLSWLYLGAQLTLWAAEINVVLHYHLWPRSVTQPPLTKADRLVYQRLAQMEVRRPEVKVATSFTDAADDDPLGGPYDPPGQVEVLGGPALSLRCRTLWPWQQRIRRRSGRPAGAGQQAGSAGQSWAMTLAGPAPPGTAAAAGTEAAEPAAGPAAVRER